MRHRSRVGFVTLIATLVFAATTATSAAAPFELIGETFKMTWSSASFEAGGSIIRCPVTLSGSFAAGSFEPTSGTRIGSVTTAALGTCTGGSLTFLSETLPWSVDYSSFGGSLPNITSLSLHIIGMTYEAQPTGRSTYLARSESAEPAVVSVEREIHGELTSVVWEEGAAIRLTGPPCRLATGRVTGSGSIEQSTIAREESVEINVYEGENVTAFGVEPEEPFTVLRNGEEPPARLLWFNFSDKDMAMRTISFTAPNAERFVRLEMPAERCQGNVTILRQGQICEIWIQSTVGTPARVDGTVEITYRVGSVRNLPGRVSYALLTE